MSTAHAGQLHFFDEVFSPYYIKRWIGFIIKISSTVDKVQLMLVTEAC